MILLNESLRENLRVQEKSNDIEAARLTLETAIVSQYSTISDGLLAAQLLSGKALSLEQWWFHYLTKVEKPKQYSPDMDDLDFALYKKSFIQATMRGQILSISVPKLSDVEICVYGGVCIFDDEGMINYQLSSLGSNLRLVAVGSDRARFHRIADILQKDYAPKVVNDGRFILGQTSPLSTFCGLGLFLFRTEQAVSPYLEVRASGFVEQWRIIVRETPFKAKIETFDEDPPPMLFTIDLHFQDDLKKGVLSDSFRRKLAEYRLSPPNDVTIRASPDGLRWAVENVNQEALYNMAVGNNELIVYVVPYTVSEGLAQQVYGKTQSAEDTLKEFVVGTLMHEAAHPIGNRLFGTLFEKLRPPGERDQLAMWRDTFRDDLVRYVRIPRNMEELENEFGYLLDATKKMPGFSVCSLEDELEQLIQEGLIEHNNKGQLYSSMYRKFSTWEI